MEFKTDITKSVFASKYLLEGETSPNQAVDRIVSVVEDYYPKLADTIGHYIHKKWLLPAGGLWRAARNPDKNVSCINCTTLPPPEDNLESIFESFYHWSKFAAFGQGEGVDLSRLRPRGSVVHNSSRFSTGAVSFMSIYDVILDVIAQQGRRGASLISLHIKHPDIPEFIYVKDKEGKISNANISIQMTDEFMGMITDEEAIWKFQFENEYETIEKEIGASELFHMICEHAWKSGDPGILLVDTAKRYSNSDVLGFPIVSTNACSFSPDTLVTTNDGVFPITELVGKTVNVWDSNQWTQVSNFRKTGYDRLYRITLNNGLYYDATSNHRFLLSDGTEKRTSELSINDSLYIDSTVESHGSIKELGTYVKGFLLGDGYEKHAHGLSSPIPALTVYDTKEACKNRIVSSLQEIPSDSFIFKKAIRQVGWGCKFSEQNKNSEAWRLKGLSCRERDTLYKWASEYKKKLPDEVFMWDKQSKVNLIAGIFDSDGCAFEDERHCFYRISSIYKEFLVSLLRLLGTFGISGKIGLKRKAQVGNIKGRVVNQKTIWILTIPKKYSIKLAQTITFERLKSFAYKSYKVDVRDYSIITSIEDLNYSSDVYCCTVPTNGRFLVNGGLISLNSEQWLDSHNVCLLSSINVAPLGTEYGESTRNDLFRCGIYMLDAFRRYEYDESRSPNSIQHEKLKTMPRIGLGITGLADYFINHQVPYGSNNSMVMSDYLFRNLAAVSYQTSYEIAVRDGKSFPAYNALQYQKSAYVQRLLKEEVIAPEWLTMQAHVCKTTIAPNGTVTMVAEVGGSGIEPIFSKYYVRRERSTTGDFQEWFTFNDAVRNYLESKGLEVTKENADALDGPEWITAHTVDNMAKIRLMSIIQKWIDSSISVTYNLPKTATIENVKQIYYEAWKHELKGVTVYREGSKEKGILITEENYNESLQEKAMTNRFSPTRPETVECDIYQRMVNKERHIVLVGLVEGKPYEIFVTNDPEKKINLSQHTKGYITKVKKGRYDLQIMNGEERTILKDISKVFDKEYGSLSRMVSMSLRHNVPLPFIVDQLAKDKQFDSFEKAVSRTLKNYIGEGEKVLTSDHTCPICGSDLIYQGGCKSCVDIENCGWSKCD